MTEEEVVVMITTMIEEEIRPEADQMKRTTEETVTLVAVVVTVMAKDLIMLAAEEMIREKEEATREATPEPAKEDGVIPIMAAEVPQAIAGEEDKKLTPISRIRFWHMLTKEMKNPLMHGVSE